MNKHIIQTFFLAFTSLTYSLSSATIELREAAYFPASHRFRDVYGNVGSQTEIEVSTKWNCSYDVWVNFSWFSKKNRNKPIAYGYSEGSDYSAGSLKSRIRLPNVGTGLKYTFPVRCLCSKFDLYAGLGIILGRVYLHNRTDFMHEKTSKVAVGGIIKTGLDYCITECVFVDLFADYIYQPVKFHHRNVNIGALKIGGGLGVKF